MVPSKAANKKCVKKRQGHKSNSPADANLNEPVKSYKPFDLPDTPGGWTKLNKSEKRDPFTINTLKEPDSGSNIRLHQFLALRVIWPKTDSLKEFLDVIGFQRQDFKDRESAMFKENSWQGYLKVLKANFNKPSKPYRLSTSFPVDVGRFEVALENQLEIFRKEETRQAREPEEPPSSRLRPRTPVSARPLTPVKQLNTDNIEHATPGHPGIQRPPAADSETIVGMALIAFLQAIWRLGERHETRWTSRRKIFHFVPKDKTGKGFVAIPDGHLTLFREELADKSAAILEVKAAQRDRRQYGRHQVCMQESAEMALWIVKEPNSHWTAPLRPDSGGNEGEREGENYYRVQICQDREEMFITLARYTSRYVDYLRGESATEDAFLEMLQFGPYEIKDPGHMSAFGSQISVLLDYARDFALKPFAKASNAKLHHPDDDEKELTDEMSNVKLGDSKQNSTTPPSHQKEPRRTKPQTGSSSSGHVHRGGGDGHRAQSPGATQLRRVSTSSSKPPLFPLRRTNSRSSSPSATSGRHDPECKTLNHSSIPHKMGHRAPAIPTIRDPAHPPGTTSYSQSSQPSSRSSFNSLEPRSGVSALPVDAKLLPRANADMPSRSISASPDGRARPFPPGGRRYAELAVESQPPRPLSASPLRNVHSGRLPGASPSASAPSPSASSAPRKLDHSRGPLEPAFLARSAVKPKRNDSPDHRRIRSGMSDIASL